MSFMNEFKKRYWEVVYTCSSHRFPGTREQHTHHTLASDEAEAKKRTKHDAGIVGRKFIRFQSVREAPDLHPMRQVYLDRIREMNEEKAKRLGLSVDGHSEQP